jgi:hypothetical protein
MANDVTSKVIFGIDPSEFRRGIQQVDAKLKQTAGLFDNLGKAIGATFAVGIIQNFAKEAMMLGDQLTKVSQGFDRFGDPAELQKLRYATRGLVSDLELMKQVTMAGNFGIGIKEMGTLLEFATRRAAETGQEVDYLVNSIVTGIGRKSTLILDNLGISASRLKEELHGVSLEMASVADISAAVGRIASGQLEVMGDAIETATDRMERLNATWDNMKAKAGQFLTRWGVATAEVFGRLVGGYSIIQESNRPVSPGATEPSMFTSPYPSFNFRAQPQPNKAPFSPPTLEKITLAKKAMSDFGTVSLRAAEVLRSSTIPSMQDTGQAARDIVTSLERYNAEMALLNQVGAEFGYIFTSSFNAAMVNGTSFFEEMKNALKAYIAQMLVAVGVTAALAAVMTAIRPGLSFGKAFKGLAGGTGLGSIFGEGGLIELIGTLKGFDLQMTSNRANKFLRSGN